MVENEFPNSLLTSLQDQKAFYTVVENKCTPSACNVRSCWLHLKLLKGMKDLACCVSHPKHNRLHNVKETN